MDNIHKGRLRVLIYPIQFDPNPVEGIDRVLLQIAGENPVTFMAAIDAGLQSDELLSELIPQPHPESVMRAYLAAVRPRLPSGPG
jgi:molybdopterin-guanine dinucleotide biosynthesis protein A